MIVVAAGLSLSYAVPVAIKQLMQVFARAALVTFESENA